MLTLYLDGRQPSTIFGSDHQLQNYVRKNGSAGTLKVLVEEFRKKTRVLKADEVMLRLTMLLMLLTQCSRAYS